MPPPQEYDHGGSGGSDSGRTEEPTVGVVEGISQRYCFGRGGDSEEGEHDRRDAAGDGDESGGYAEEDALLDFAARLQALACGLHGGVSFLVLMIVLSNQLFLPAVAGDVLSRERHSLMQRHKFPVDPLRIRVVTTQLLQRHPIPLRTIARRM